MMKNNLVITLGIILFAILIIAIGCVPKLLKDYEIKSNAIVKNNCKAIVQDILDIKDNALLKEKSGEIVLKYNESYRNPFTKEENAFTTDKKCIGCVNIDFDNATKSINVTGYGKDLKILCRTIINPPSFVTYESEEK